MPTQITNCIENGVLYVAASNSDSEYMIWQNELESGDVHFEYNNQINGDYNNIVKSTVMKDGIHIVLKNGETAHFYFIGLDDEQYKILLTGLKNIHKNNMEILEIQDD